MPSTAAIDGHPIHALLVNIPVAFILIVLLLDVLYYYTKKDPLWAQFACFCQVIAVLGLLAAVIPGLIDYYTMPMAPTPSFRHLIAGIILTVFSIIHLALRRPRKGEMPKVMPVMAVIGAILVSIQGYLGGELVYRYHVGIIPTPDAPATTQTDGSGPHPPGGTTGTTTGGSQATTTGPAPIPVVDAVMLATVKAAFKAQCLGCHKMAGIPGGGDSGPDLSHAGQKHDAPWISKQMLKPTMHNPNTTMPDFPEKDLPTAQREAMSVWLASLK